MLNYFIAALFFVIFIFGLVDGISTNSTALTVGSFAVLIIAILYFIKARSKRIHIRINKKGLYHDEKLVTDWAHFLNATISQKERVWSIQDNFILVVEYLKDHSKKGFRRSIPLTNTQNQSEEDVLAAVKFFWNQFRVDAGMTEGHRR